MAAQITINQAGGAGAGTPGEARNDIWLATAVQLVSSGTGSTYLWEMLDKPAASGATLSTPTGSSSAFTPDLVGTYRIRLTVDGGGVGNVVTLVIRVRYSSSGILTARGWALPAVEEFDTENNYGGNDRGWAEVWEGVIPQISAALTTLVFRPDGGTNAGHVFSDWEALMETFAGIAGPVLIEIDDSSSSPAVIPASYWNMESRAVFVGRAVGPLPAMRLSNGAFLENPAGFRGVSVTVTGTDVGSVTVGASKSIVIEDSTFTNNSSAGPLMTADESSLILRGNSALRTTAGQPVVLLGTTINTVFTLEDVSDIGTDALAGSPTSTTVNLIGVSSSCSSTQTGLTGTFTINAPLVPEPYTFVFRPGYAGPSQPNVYTSWAALMTDLGAVDGPKVVQFDDTDGAISIPTGTWDFGYETTLRGLDEGNTGTGVQVTCGDGAILKDVYALDQGVIIKSTSTRAIFEWKYDGMNQPLVLHMDHGAEIESGTITAPISLSNGDHLIISMRGQSVLRKTTGTAVVDLIHAAADFKLVMYDASGIVGDVINVVAGIALAALVDDAVRWNHSAVSGLTVERWASRRWVYPLSKSAVTDATGTPVVTGAAYIDPSEFPSYYFLTAGLTAKFRVVLETTAPGQAAVIDLFDTNGVFNAGTPAPVAGSQQDTATGTPPTRPFAGTPVTPNPLVASTYEVDLSSVFVGGAWSGAGVFEARLWIATAGGGNVATCKSAELIFEW